MLITQDLLLIHLECRSHRTSSCLYICLDLPLIASFVGIRGSQGTLDGFSHLFPLLGLWHSCFRKNVWLMQYANAMPCMTLHEWNVCALYLLLWYFLLLNLRPFRPCTLCGPVGSISFSSVLEDISMLAYCIISYFPFLENKSHSCPGLYVRNTGLFVFMLWTSQFSRYQ